MNITIDIVSPERKNMECELENLREVLKKEFAGVKNIIKTIFNEYRVLNGHGVIGVFYMSTRRDGRLRDFSYSEIEDMKFNN